MTKFVSGNGGAHRVSRRLALRLGAAATGATLMPRFIGQVGKAYADDRPPLGTWPAGSEGEGDPGQLFRYCPQAALDGFVVGSPAGGG